MVSSPAIYSFFVPGLVLQLSRSMINHQNPLGHLSHLTRFWFGWPGQSSLCFWCRLPWTSICESKRSPTSDVSRSLAPVSTKRDWRYPYSSATTRRMGGSESDQSPLGHLSASAPSPFWKADAVQMCIGSTPREFRQSLVFPAAKPLPTVWA